MIDWKSRVKNKAFWLSLIPAVLLLIQAIATPFGYEWDFTVLNQQLAGIINAVFALLAILGIVVNPETPGVSDGNDEEE